MQRMIIWLWCTLLCIQVPAQGGSHPGSVQKGQKMPDGVLGVDARSGKTMYTRDLKGKLVIFDFWNIWCSSCIAAMPKMQSLQKQFGDQLQVILVTKNTARQGQALFSKLKRDPPALPMFYSDTVLNSLFPHVAEPLHVWMLPDGRIGYITEAHNATEDNIARVLKGEVLPFSYRQEIMDLDLSQSLLSEVPRLKKNIHAYSMLMKNLSNLTTDNHIKVETDSVSGKVVRIQANNASIWQLYNIAFNRDLYGDRPALYSWPKNNRILLMDSVARDLLFPRDMSQVDAWQERNLYCYEIFLPQESKADIFKQMQQDLNRYFNVEGHMEKRLMKVLALVKDSGTACLPSGTGTKPSITYSGDQLSIRNLPLRSSLLPKLEEANYRLDTPIVDQTHYKDAVDLDIACHLDDLACVRQKLRLVGMDLVEKTAWIDVLVIRSK